MREIVSGVRRVNISWSCDSLEPVTQYYLRYRHHQVSVTKDIYFIISCSYIVKYYILKCYELSCIYLVPLVIHPVPVYFEMVL